MRTILVVLILAVCSWASDFYMAPAGASPAGSDANNGTAPATPWLTPNHALNCGDKIHAIAGTYAASSFSSGNWGTVTCAAGNNVAWVWCDVFDTCKITASSAWGMWLSKNYWGVQGFEATESGNNGLCFGISPVSGTTIHHIVVANSVCNSGANGFSASSASSTASFDYVAFVGDIAWNASTSTLLGNSGFTIYEPIKSDSLPGTHNYIGGSFSFDNIATPFAFDGNGIVLDDIGNTQSGGAAYDQQILVENNIAVWNGGYGVATTGNGSTLAKLYFRQNTSVHNLIDGTTSTTTCGDMTLLVGSLIEMYGNLIQTTGPTACSGPTTAYGMAVNGADATDHIYNNYIYSASGSNTVIISSTGFSYGPNNTTGTSPAFASLADPGSPNCTGKASTVDCMSTVIANYTPATAAAKPYGYQSAVTPATQTFDPLFPQWLCNVGLPSGLITMHCVSSSSYRANLDPPINLKAYVK